MPLVSAKQLLVEARKHNYAIPAFNVENVEMVQACIEAAEEYSSPIILATTEASDRFIPLNVFHGFVKPLAEASSVPISLHLDHSKNRDLVLKAIKAGYTSVMIDASKKPYFENINITRSIKSICDIFEIPLEAELGVIVGKKSDGTKSYSLTDPETVFDFIDKTKVDSLAVSIGNKHGLYDAPIKLDFDRLQKINEVSDVPLVLHGASGIPDLEVKKCVALGINKCNFATELRISYANSIKNELSKENFSYDPRDFLSIAREHVKKVCISKILLLGSNNRA